MNSQQNILFSKPARDANNALYAGKRLTVDATAGGVQVSMTGYDQNLISTFEIDVQDQDAYVTFDGTTPSSSNGHRLYAGQAMTWSYDRVSIAKFIRQGSSNSSIQFSPSAS